jgi:hypothetical protein
LNNLLLFPVFDSQNEKREHLSEAECEDKSESSQLKFTFLLSTFYDTEAWPAQELEIDS